MCWDKSRTLHHILEKKRKPKHGSEPGDNGAASAADVLTLCLLAEACA
jgi:hypothetical protein